MMTSVLRAQVDRVVAYGTFRRIAARTGDTARVAEAECYQAQALDRVAELAPQAHGLEAARLVAQARAADPQGPFGPRWAAPAADLSAGHALLDLYHQAIDAELDA
jgi:hypothetical protein